MPCVILIVRQNKITFLNSRSEIMALSADGPLMKREAAAAQREKLLDTHGDRKRNTGVQKGREKCGEIPRFLFGRSRVETGERRVASPEQMFDLQEELRCSDGKVCQGHAGASQGTCPHPAWNLILPCHAISWD